MNEQLIGGNMINKQYDAVIFDLDGTLIDSMWVWEKLDEAFLGELNIPVPQDMNKELEGKSFTESAIYFKERFKLEMSIEEIMQKWNDTAKDLYMHKVPLKKGVKEFIEALKQNGIKMGIATSNSIELVNIVLKALEIEPYFMQVRTSCEVGKGKPFPDIYLKVADDLQVKPERCLVFEDIPNGVRAGKNAGMTAWCIRDRQEEVLWEEAKSVADDYAEDYFEVMKKLGMNS